MEELGGLSFATLNGAHMGPILMGRLECRPRLSQSHFVLYEEQGDLSLNPFSWLQCTNTDTHTSWGCGREEGRGKNLP